MRIATHTKRPSRFSSKAANRRRVWPRDFDFGICGHRVVVFSTYLLSHGAGVPGQNGEDSMRKLLALAGMVLVAAGSTVAHAASPGAQTRGDAQAQFESFFTGGASIRVHNPEAQGVPGVPGEPPLDSARIYPLLDGVEYCQDGWHVVVLGTFDDPTFYEGGQHELRDLLSQIEMQFFVDGVPLETQSTAIKRFQQPLPEFYEFPLLVRTFGAFLPPGSLALGTHELRTLVDDPVFGDFELTVSFTVVPC